MRPGPPALPPAQQDEGNPDAQRACRPRENGRRRAHYSANPQRRLAASKDWYENRDRRRDRFHRQPAGRGVRRRRARRPRADAQPSRRRRASRSRHWQAGHHAGRLAPERVRPARGRRSSTMPTRSINLAGEPIGEGRWTPQRKAVLRDSRILATRSVVEAIRGGRNPPQVLISASAIGYYGAIGRRTEDGRLTGRQRLPRAARGGVGNGSTEGRARRHPRRAVAHRCGAREKSAARCRG